jgi:hypothetical protein
MRFLSLLLLLSVLAAPGRQAPTQGAAASVFVCPLPRRRVSLHHVPEGGQVRQLRHGARAAPSVPQVGVLLDPRTSLPSSMVVLSLFAA